MVQLCTAVMTQPAIQRLTWLSGKDEILEFNLKVSGCDCLRETKFLMPLAVVVLGMHLGSPCTRNQSPHVRVTDWVLTRTTAQMRRCYGAKRTANNTSLIARHRCLFFIAANSAASSSTRYAEFCFPPWWAVHQAHIDDIIPFN